MTARNEPVDEREARDAEHAMKSAHALARRGPRGRLERSQREMALRRNFPAAAQVAGPWRPQQRREDFVHGAVLPPYATVTIMPQLSSKKQLIVLL